MLSETKKRVDSSIALLSEGKEEEETFTTISSVTSIQTTAPTPRTISSPTNTSSSSTNSSSSSKKQVPEKKVWWLVLIIVSFVHLVSLLSLLFYTPKPQTLTLVFWTWIIGGMGITMGYHRLWSHNAFKASLPVRILLSLAGAMAFQGSIKWWGLRHRLHHRYTDTEHDPYDATRGFWYSHMGWMFEKSEYIRLKWIDKTDLEEDIVVKIQHAHFPALALIVGIVMPTLLGALWGDALGGFLYGGYVSRVVIWHTTWFINSLAHSWGDQEFSTETTARGNVVLALLTHGEGHHNFHHEFPRDYRNGITWDSWDPTKWMIALLSFVGGTYELKRVSDDVIMKARVTAAQDKIKEMNKKLIWCDETKLPHWSLKDFQDESKTNDLLLIEGFAINIGEFKADHPGGEALVSKFIGKDATKSFYGVLNNHTKSAREIMRDLRVAKVSNEKKEE